MRDVQADGRVLQEGDGDVRGGVALPAGGSMCFHGANHTYECACIHNDVSTHVHHHRDG